MAEDIRDKAYIGHNDVVALNFINPKGRFFFRRHFRQGLRSHVMEVLLQEDVEIEKRGKLVNGVRWYPKAVPRHVFRIFRTRLETVDQALREIRRLRIAERYLLPHFLAPSMEIILDYRGPKGTSPLLCGLQEYVEGQILDPWSPLPPNALYQSLHDRLRSESEATTRSLASWHQATRRSIARFIHQVKLMIAETGYIPDLAGIGNLMMTPAGAIKLVDINNISKIAFDGTVHLDDRGYPVCDKSIEVLFILEHKLTDRSVNRGENLYHFFLTPERMDAVRARELAYHRSNMEE
jgi:hypothetical protein